MNRSEKAFAFATGIVSFAITLDPRMYEVGLGSLAFGALLVFVFTHKSALRQHRYGFFSIWFDPEDAPIFKTNRVEARWIAIGFAVCAGVTSGYLVQAFLG